MRNHQKRLDCFGTVIATEDHSAERHSVELGAQRKKNTLTYFGINYMTTKPRTLHDYRPQHDEDCDIRQCVTCGGRLESYWHESSRSWMPSYHAPQAQPCSCGLAALLEAVPQLDDHEKNDHGASLLPVDPSASPTTTEALPNDDDCREAQDNTPSRGPYPK